MGLGVGGQFAMIGEHDQSKSCHFAVGSLVSAVGLCCQAYFEYSKIPRLVGYVRIVERPADREVEKQHFDDADSGLHSCQ
jgi:hypothetical protein